MSVLNKEQIYKVNNLVTELTKTLDKAGVKYMFELQTKTEAGDFGGADREESNDWDASWC